MKNKKHILISLLFLSFMTGNIMFNSVFSEYFLDFSADELVVEKEIEEEKELKDYYLFEKKNIQINSKTIEFNSAINTIKNSIYLVYIDIVSPPPEL